MENQSAYKAATQVLGDPSSHIRILVLEKGTYKDTIRCATHVVATADKPLYTALSYTWGDASIVRGICFNGCDNFGVTTNLHSALQHLRLVNEERTLWVDALCINQADSAEKNVQVAMMAQIYQQASDTIIWLGPASDNSDLAMDTISRLDGQNLDCAANSLTPDELDAVVELMQRPWWSRVWIIQGMALDDIKILMHLTNAISEALFSDNVTVQCGGKCLEMLDFMRLDDLRRDYHRASQTKVRSSNSISKNATALKNPFCSILTYWPESRQQVRGGQSSLSEWSSYLQEFRATDPRDKIYAIIGLGNENDRRVMKIAYEKEMKTNLVFHRTSYWNVYCARCLIEWQRDQDNKATILRVNGEDLPLASFVNDFSEQPPDPDDKDWFRPLYVPFVFQDQYKATGDGKILGQYIQEPNPKPEHATIPAVYLRGLLVDKIAIVLANPHIRPYRGTDPAERLRTRSRRYRQTSASLRAWREEFEARWPTTQYHDGADTSAEDTFLRTITANRDGEGRFLAPAGPSSPNPGDLSRQLALWNAIDRDFPDADDGSPQLAERLDSLDGAARAVLPRVSGRNFFVTEKGYVGLGPLKSQPGDGVYVLEGGCVPFVLRQVPEDEIKESGIELREAQSLVILIGESYVHGVSDGEWMSQQEGDAIIEIVVC